MMRITTPIPAAVGALTIFATPLHADVEQAWWHNETDFGYEISHMPDFDQQRLNTPEVNGLPDNGGWYCVPTAVMNMLAYIGNHGFPEVPPGSGFWQLDTEYDKITFELTLMGALMGTTPMGGTNALGAHNGMHLWLGQYPDFAVYTYWAHDNWSPTLSDLTFQAVQGHLVSFAYGRYFEASTLEEGFPTLTRSPGHQVTLTGTVRNGAYQQVSYRDPADDFANTTQSSFGNRYFDVDDGFYGFGESNLTREVSELLVDADDDLRRIIDSSNSIRLRTGLSYAPGSDALRLVVPLAFFGTPPSDTAHHLVSTAAIIDAATDPGTGLIVMALDDTGGPSNISTLNPVTGEVSLVRNLTGPVLENPIAMTQGRKRELYVVTGTAVVCLDIDLEGFLSASLPFTGTAMAYDDASNRLVWIHAGTGIRQIWHVNEGLVGGLTVKDIPTTVNLNPSARIAVGPDSRVWMVSPGVNTIYGFTAEQGQPLDIVEVTLPAVQNPTSISVDERGDLYVVCDAGVRQLHHDGNAWAAIPGMFDDIGPDAVVEIARSRTNYDPAQHSGPGWDNVDPALLVRNDEFEPDCPGDVNFDGTVDVLDLLALLGGWGTSDGGPDANVDGVVDVLDLLLLLGNWGGSC